MRRIKSIMAMALMAMLAFTFTSCDDEEIAYTLEGTWKGNMYISSNYDGQTYNSTYSEICFVGDPYTNASGSGYWVDYYNNAGWGRNYVANHITWSVRNEIIYVHFVEDNNDFTISNYRLNDDQFSGTIYDGDNYVEFDLVHTSSPNWNDYQYGDGWNNAKSAKGNTVKKPVRFLRSQK